MHRNMTTTNHGVLEKNKFRLFYLYSSLLIEEKTETLIYDFVGNTNITLILDALRLGVKTSV